MVFKLTLSRFERVSGGHAGGFWGGSVTVYELKWTSFNLQYVNEILIMSWVLKWENNYDFQFTFGSLCVALLFRRDLPVFNKSDVGYST
jgi:hypothetical protein